VRGNLDHPISDSVTLRGNVGFQVIHTDQSSSSFFAANGGADILRVGDGETYTDYLPQLNFAFLLPNDQAVRVGFAKELARPRMDQLKATEESGYAMDGTPSGTGGNPRLDPWRAWAFDVSWEKYIAEGSYVSVAGFYKDLRTYIFTQTDPNHDFSNLLAVTPDSFFDFDGDGDPDVVPDTTGSFSRPVNGEGGYLWGLEVATAVPFEIFSDALDGFGAILSYSYTESDITVQGSVSSVASDSIPLPGLSEDVWNATLYYEKYGFGVRIATRYRSEYIGEVTNFANERGLRFVDDEMLTDAQVGYAFGEGRLDGLQLLFQVNNVTNEPYIAYSVNKSRLLDFQEYGTQYLVGANYRF
jgi:iron complex outermembrane receptor protein